MSIIYSYPEQGALNPNDMLIGTSAEVVGGKQKNITRNFSIQQIADYINDGGTVFNPAATDFQIAVFNQGGTKLTGSIISQNTFPNGTFVTIAGDLIANAATLNGAVAINGFLTLNGGATLGSGAAGELIAFASTTRLNAPIQDQLGRVGALDQILISDTAGRVSWQNYTSGLTYTGTWDALNNVTAPQGTPIVSSSGTNGEFYIVTLAGNTPLNGQPPAPTTPAYWQVGDWVVFVEDGGVGVWQKIDNSSAITGTGTDNKITMWTGGATPSTSLTDSIMSQNAGNTTITVTGALTTTSNVNAGGSVIATANVSGVDVTASGNVSAVNVTASSDVSAVNVTATTTVTPTTITDKDAGVGANGQILSSTVTGVEWIDNQVGTVTGTGTTSTLPIWSDGTAGVLGNSVITQVAGGLAPSTDPADTLSGLFTNIGGASTTYDIGAIGSTFNENLFSTLNLTQFAAGDQVEISNGTSSFRLTLVAQGTILGGVNGTVISGTQTGFAVNGLTGTITLLVAVAARITIAGDATVDGDFSTQGLEVNKYLTDGAGNKGTDGQVLTSTTVAADKEIVWTTPTVGTVTNFTTVSTAIPGITTVVADPTTTPTLTLGITGTPTAALFLDGTGNWSSPGGGVTDITATAPLNADVATGSVILSMPAYVTATGGYVPSGGTAGQYLDGSTGSWTTLPAGDTYTLGSSTDGSNVKLNLDAASGTDSAITLTGAGGLTVAQTNNIVTLTAPAGSDTTYFLTAGAKNQNKVPLNLTSSVAIGSTVVNLTEGTGITLTRNAGNQVTIASTAAIGNFLPLSGGTMTGVISMGSDKITNVDDPTSPQDAATKQYVDDSVVGGLIYQGGYNASTNSPVLDSRGSQIAVSKGWTYTVTTDGTFYTETVKIGDVLIAEVDITAGTGALTDWTTVQSNIDVASATVQGIANFPNQGDGLRVSTGTVTARTFGDGTGQTYTTGGYVPSASSAAAGTFLSKTGSWVIPPNTGGTVTSVGLSTNVAALTVGTPVTGSGTLTLNRNGGTAGQYIDGASGAWTDLPAPGTGTVTGTGAATQVTFWDGTSNINGDTAFNWDNTNKRLGIGTDSPDEKLDVENGNIRLKSNSDGSTGLFRIYDAAGIEAGQIYPHSGDLRIFSNNDVVFNQTGNVGIDTTTPSTLLSLGAALDAQKLLLYDNGPNSNYKYGFGIQTAELRQFFPNSATAKMTFGTIDDSDGTTYSEKLRIDSSGNSTFTGQSGSTTGTGVVYVNNADDAFALVINNAGTSTQNDRGVFDARVGTTSVFRINNSGNVGIGTTGPVAKLHVMGTGVSATDKPTMQSESVLTVKPLPASSGNLNFASINGGAGIGLQYTNGPGTANWDIALQPFGGNVGIGNTAPNYPLDIAKSTGSAYMRLARTFAGSESNILFGAESSRNFIQSRVGTGNGAQRIDFLIGSTQRLSIGTAGQIGLSSTNYGTDGQVLTSKGSGAAAVWQAAASGLPTKTVANLTGNGTDTTMALNATPSSTAYVDMYIDGVYQNKNTFSVSGSTLTLLSGATFPNGVSVETVTTT